jgi:hypothetical protein
MIFNNHSNLVGLHAFLSPSNYHWINYDEEKLVRTYLNHLAVQRGTELHAYAADAIRLGIRQARSNKTLNSYINDAIGYRMAYEQPLYFSDNCFGTADSISFRNGLLRIHDLKTGNMPASMNQLMIYAALFCLEYDHEPKDIRTELRIYQNDQIQVCEPDSDEISRLMDKIIFSDKTITKVVEGDRND